MQKAVKVWLVALGSKAERDENEERCRGSWSPLYTFHLITSAANTSNYRVVWPSVYPVAC